MGIFTSIKRVKTSHDENNEHILAHILNEDNLRCLHTLELHNFRHYLNKILQDSFNIITLKYLKIQLIMTFTYDNYFTKEPSILLLL